MVRIYSRLRPRSNGLDLSARKYGTSHFRINFTNKRLCYELKIENDYFGIDIERLKRERAQLSLLIFEKDFLEK